MAAQQLQCQSVRWQHLVVEDLERENVAMNSMSGDREVHLPNTGTDAVAFPGWLMVIKGVAFATAMVAPQV